MQRAMVRAYSAVIERETERVVRSVTNVKRLESVLTRQTSELKERRRLFDEKKMVSARSALLTNKYLLALEPPVSLQDWLWSLVQLVSPCSSWNCTCLHSTLSRSPTSACSDKGTQSACNNGLPETLWPRERQRSRP